MRALVFMLAFSMGMMLSVKPQKAFAGGGGEEKADDHKKEAAHGEEGGEGGGIFDEGASIVRLNPITIPIISQRGRAESMFSFSVILEVEDAGAATEIREKMPHLTDGYIQKLYGAVDEGALLPNGLVDLDKIKGQIAYVTSEILTENADKVTSVLLERVTQRNL